MAAGAPDYDYYPHRSIHPICCLSMPSGQVCFFCIIDAAFDPLFFSQKSTTILEFRGKRRGLGAWLCWGSELVGGRPRPDLALKPGPTSGGLSFAGEDSSARGRGLC